MTPDAEPDLLFSPQPSPPKPDPMVGERGHDSALFELARLADRSTNKPAAQREESSGLVDLKSIAGGSRVENSGLVEILHLVPPADGQPSSVPVDSATWVPPVLSLVTPTQLVAPPPTAIAPPRAPAIPTNVLIAAIVTLLAAAVVLTWKLLQ